jgi:hypothetical protein
MELAEAANVVDMRMRADDHIDSELVATDKVQDARNFIARINDHGFTRDWISDDGAIALEHSHGNGDVNQTLAGGVQGGQSVVHESDYIIGTGRICGCHCMGRCVLC